MTGTINLHVDSVEAMGKRFIRAWHALEQGTPVDETHLTFLDMQTLVSVLSPERLALLREVRRHPPEDVAALAQSLQRDDRRVNQDVAILVRAGLLERDASRIRTPYNSVHTEVSLV
jgi:predicted transcriptional regulator